MILAVSGFQILVFLVLGGALVFVIVLLFKGKKPPPMPHVDLSSLTIRDAQRGDMITVQNAGRDYEDLSFNVEKIHRYEWGGTKWYELEGPSPGGRIFLEWIDDDGLYVSLTKPGASFRIQELGLTEEDLARFDEEQSASNKIEYDGKTYHYESSHETGFFEDGKGDGEGFYLWSFDSEDEKHSLGVEKWEGEAFEVSVSEYVDPSDVKIYRS